MEKLKMKSKDKREENLKKLKELFPNVLTEVVEGYDDGNNPIIGYGIDKDILQQEISAKVVEGSEERYQFTWPEKKKAIIKANEPINKTLRPCKEESVNFDTTENLYIEGDNLEVLKLLQETYLNKVKMIYIDPPYNTGKDFIYNDDFKEERSRYKEKGGEIDEEGNRLVKNPESNGRYHTDWLNMIYPRLKLAKELLSEDGVIFISIDDNEQENLKKTCDEIFGEHNSLGEMIRKTKSTTNDSKTGMNIQHEYLLIYSRNINNIVLKGEDKDFKNYSNKDNDPNGKWISGDPSARTGYYFNIVNPYTGKIDLPPKNAKWRFSEDRLKEWIESGKIVFKREHKKEERGFIFKRYLNEIKSDRKTIDSLKFTENIYMNQTATKKLLTLFDIKVFDYSKSEDFILNIVEFIDDKEFLVLDFFSGSATTAHAVMKLNAEDGGKRKYIMVQLPEETDEKSEAYKAGYKNICEIGKERIRRAAKKIKEEKPESDFDDGFILILDEPQKMNGKVTREAIKNFNPLFTINYSATHVKENNLIYVLDPLDAYNKKLVKKIEVKGFEVKNLTGSSSYIYLEDIDISPKEEPKGVIEIEIKQKSGIRRKRLKVKTEDNLYYKSGELEQYRGYTVSEVDPYNDKIIFTNGVEIEKGQGVGDISEEHIRRIQIRETIISHFEKEEKLYKKGIKTLSLFFIDEVSKYRSYDEEGNEVLGEYGKIFEEEYREILSEYSNIYNTEYQNYLKNRCSEVYKVHNGYFSIDKKTKRITEGSIKKNTGLSDDIDAYDLILKNKERLLSFEEPTRFIFSHSALREGWDNPNIFQICTLKHSENDVVRRQEVGRGLRLSVNKEGVRMDLDNCGSSVHDINLLTVIASESYDSFVKILQSEIKESLYERPTKATREYFKGKIVNQNGENIEISEDDSKKIHHYLTINEYIDYDDNITEKYKNDVAENKVAEMPQELRSIENEVHRLVKHIYDESVIENMIENGNKTKVKENKLNDNFKKKEFQELWENINQKYTYRVDFEPEELIKKAIGSIDQNLLVSKLTYRSSIGKQKEEITEEELKNNDSFKVEESHTKFLVNSYKSPIKYDLLGKISNGTNLTRRSIARILQKISGEKIQMFNRNPEEFISKVTSIINEQKGSMIVENIKYNKIDEKFDSSIFTAGEIVQDFKKAFKAEKHIQDYVFTDGISDNSIEKKFVKELDTEKEVVVYAKLPKGFKIPTPLGNYTPDWAIAFEKEAVKYVYFIAETKGSMDTMELRGVEKAKIECAKKLFNEMSDSKVRYDKITNYDDLLKIVGK